LWRSVQAEQWTTGRIGNDTLELRVANLERGADEEEPPIRRQTPSINAQLRFVGDIVASLAEISGVARINCDDRSASVNRFTLLST
jgi:hypothetical protein